MQSIEKACNILVNHFFIQDQYKSYNRFEKMIQKQIMPCCVRSKVYSMGLALRVFFA